jgi:hypothetical protein
VDQVDAFAANVAAQPQDGSRIEQAAYLELEDWDAERLEGRRAGPSGAHPEIGDVDAVTTLEHDSRQLDDQPRRTAVVEV